MTIQEKVEIIKYYPLFQEIPSKDLEVILARTTERIFPPKAIILAQNEPSKNMYFVYKGLIKVYITNVEGKIIPIRVVGAPYIVGELNIFDNESTASIETVQEAHTLTFSIEDCKKLILNYPSFAFNMLKIVVEKLRAANKTTEYYLTISLKERIWDILKTLSSSFPNNEIALSQEEFATVVGATRARVTEVLNEFEGQKLISLSHRKIKVL